MGVLSLWRAIYFLLAAQAFIGGIANSADLRGHPLPFTVYRVVGNPMFNGGMVGGFVDVLVDPGSQPGDWAATAVTIAEASITNGITFAEVNVLLRTPPGIDDPPQFAIELARAYYAPVRDRAPWGKTWGIEVVPFEATPPELYEIAAYWTALGRYESQISDPDKLDAFARRKALSLVRSQYKLPGNWKPRDIYGVGDPERDRSDIEIEPSADISASMAELAACLNKPRYYSMQTWGCSP